MLQRIINALVDQGASANMADISQTINFLYFIRTQADGYRLFFIGLWDKICHCSSPHERIIFLFRG